LKKKAHILLPLFGKGVAYFSPLFQRGD